MTQTQQPDEPALPVPSIVFTGYNDSADVTSENFTIEVDGQYVRFEEWHSPGADGAEWYTENGDVTIFPFGDEDEVDTDAADALFEARKQAFAEAFYPAYSEHVQPVLDRIIAEAIEAANAVDPESVPKP